MSEAIKKARDELAAEKQRLHTEATQLAERIEQIGNAIHVLDTITAQETRDIVGPPVTIEPQRAKRQQVMPHVERVLRDRPGEKMHLTEVEEAIRQNGIVLTAKNPQNSIVTVLLRMAGKGLVVPHGGNVYEWIGGSENGDERSNGAYEQPISGGATEPAVSDRLPEGG